MRFKIRFENSIKSEVEKKLAERAYDIVYLIN